MANDRARNELVGEMLTARRDELDLKQADVAEALGISQRSVSAVERGEHGIARGKRGRWEAALQLRHGTLGRAYRDGTPLEPADSAGEPGESWRDEEWTIYSRAADYPEERRRSAVNLVRMALWGLPERRDWTPPSDEDHQSGQP